MVVVIYCRRCLVDIDIPLNQGCFTPFTIQIPVGSLYSPAEKVVDAMILDRCGAEQRWKGTSGVQSHIKTNHEILD